MDQQIPLNVNQNQLHVESGFFCKNILLDISLIQQERVSKLKTKLHHTCEIYSTIKVILLVN